MPVWHAGQMPMQGRVLPPKWKKTPLSPVVVNALLAIAAVAIAVTLFMFFGRPHVPAKYDWRSAGAPRVCDANHDGVEDFVGDIAYGNGIAITRLIDGKTFEPVCDALVPSCVAECVTIEKPARVYLISGKTLTISEPDGRLLKRIGK